MGTSTTGVGVFGRGGAAAGSFDGDVIVTGNITANGRISAGANIDLGGHLTVKGNVSVWETSSFRERIARNSSM
jgi:hypothetical protein